MKPKYIIKDSKFFGENSETDEIIKTNASLEEAVRFVRLDPWRYTYAKEKQNDVRG